MMNSPADGGSAKVSGHRSSFSQACNLLSRYVKEKKAIGDLSLGILDNIDERGSNNVFRLTTMNLFPVNDKPEAEEKPILSDSRSFDLVPQPLPSETQSSQMTIFYAGQVIVVNDFSPDKAKEILELASRGISQKSISNTIPVTHVNANNTNAKNDSPVLKSVVDMTALAPPSANKFANSPDHSHQIQGHVQQTTSRIITDLPIARKASLHRFLEKRKDRIKAKAPYNASKSGVAPSKPSNSTSWLGLAAAQPSSLQSGN